MSIKQLNEERNKAYLDARKIIDTCDEEAREITAEEEQRFDALMDAGNDADKKIKDLQRREAVAGFGDALAAPQRNLPAVPGAPRGDVVNRSSSSDYERDFRHYMATGERRSLSIGNDGAVVPDDMLSRLIEFRNQTNVITNFVRTETFPNDVQIPRELTKPAISGFVAEGAEAEEIEGTFNAADIGAYKQFAGTSYTQEFLQDARIPVVETVSRQLGEAHGKNVEKFACVGNGTTQPSGLFSVTDATINDVETAGSGAIEYEDIVNMVVGTHKPQYLPGAGFLMHQSVWAEILKLRAAGATGMPMIEAQGSTDSTLAGGASFRLMGYPVFLSEFAPTWTNADAANSECIVFMPPEAALLAYRNTMSMLVDPYAGFTGAGGTSVASNASLGKVTIFSFMRWDQIIARGEAITRLSIKA